MSCFSIKYNNSATNDPCAVCGERTDPETGPELFLSDSWQLVCWGCGGKYAPELTECLRAYRLEYFPGTEEGAPGSIGRIFDEDA
jgi:hypothetical protein